jgi:uncharacterized protein (TIGR02284 family)
MAQQKEIISTVNNLIETLRDGQKGFQDAAEGVEDPELKSLFREYSMQRGKFVGELQEQARQFGESEPENSGSTSGSMHRAWMNLKAAVTSHDDYAVLTECERGEDSAVAAYDEAVKADLPMPLYETVSRQKNEVKVAHDRVRNLRDARKS